ncbi:energy transducer TonB [Microbulbifer sp. ZKSA002]|uniref:energy transducer TonB n=1 Tax=Microbulbifer sp. ZKSA002 TaxID=3243388 RepID=UPI004039C3A2
MNKLALISIIFLLCSCTDSPTSKNCSSYDECPQYIDFYKSSIEDREMAREKGGPVSVYKSLPIYPQEALEKQMEGYVIVEYDINKNGDPVDPRVIKSKPSGFFEESAIQTAKHFKYEATPEEFNNIRTKVIYNIAESQPDSQETFFAYLLWLAI